MTYVLCGAIGVLLGAVAMLVVLCTLRAQNSKGKGKSRSTGKRAEKAERPKLSLKRVTEFLFVTTQTCALIWVFTSYGIAIYSTVVLGQVYTMSELSEPAISTLMAVLVTKVLANMFEHNDGGIFGTSHKAEATADDTDTPGVG